MFNYCLQDMDSVLAHNFYSHQGASVFKEGQMVHLNLGHSAYKRRRHYATVDVRSVDQERPLASRMNLG